MAYKEPGVYLRLVTNAKYATGYTPSLIPVIIGSGAQVLERTEVITRAASGEVDLLPLGVTKILSVGVTSRKATFFETEGESVKDFKFTANDGKITWETGTTNKPEPGSNYYVTFAYEVTEDQFEPRLVFSKAEVEKYYGTDIRVHEANMPLNRIAIAANIALESGAPVIYVVQVPPALGGNVTAIEYQKVLDEKLAFIADAYRIVPVDLDADINSAIDAHIETYSSYEERKERTVVYGTPYETEPVDFNDVYDAVGNYAASKNYKRIAVVYPDKATKLLSDGNYHELDAPFIAAAYAGREAFLPVYRSKTRDKIKSFNTLKGIKMIRKQMNMLAEKGVMIFTQEYGPGTDVVCRHQLTTEMMSPQTRENSIVMIGDYASKYLRSVCEQYIGKYNITGETIARIKATLEGALYNLKKEGAITSGMISSIAQDEYNPDTLLISVRIKPPYPCNYIEITLFLD